MLPSVPEIPLHFLDWSQPLLPQAVQFLARDWSGDGPLDLSGLAVIVPTRQSGRRLREALAAHAARHGQAVFPPEVLLPESLITIDRHASGIASRHESLFAWIDLLLEIDLAAFADVFPVPPLERNIVWAGRLARQFLDLQRELAEAGLRIGDVPRRAGEPFPEAARWAQLARLERLYDQKLASCGLRDRQAARIEAARNPEPPPGVSRITLLATPDPLPLALEALERLAARLPVTILVFGPSAPAGRELFDDWGRPLPEAWNRRPVPFTDFDSQVHLCPDPAAQAERVAAIAGSYPEPADTLAIGLADTELSAPVRNALHRLQPALEAHDPEGVPMRRGSLHALIQALLDLLRDPSFDNAIRLARCPDILHCLARRGSDSFRPDRLLAGLDQLRNDHLPVTLASAIDLAHRRDRQAAERYPDVIPALQHLASLLEVLRREPFPENIASALAAIFDHRTIDTTSPEGARLTEAAAAWSEAVRAVADARRHFPRISDLDALEHALSTFADNRRFPEKPAGAIDLQGWLELLWEDAPHLVVAGFNEGRVPAAIIDDPWLPGSLRERLGMKTNAERYARDQYILEALLSCRPPERGRVDLLLGKTNTAGDPLRPSRLLFACPDDDLPARVRNLFRELPAAGRVIPWRRAWKLRLPPPEPLEKISITAFRTWLKCPLRFHLRYNLRMEAVDPFKNELEPRDFGSLCHAVLEAFGRDATMRHCTDAGDLADYLLARLDEEVERRYGSPLPPAVIVQLESMRQRLVWAAREQARLRAEGWVIEEIEHPIEGEIAGMTVTGKIDRVDRHEQTGEVRLIDYKTADNPEPPGKAHSSPLGRKFDPEALPPFVLFDHAGKKHRWLDLQLPLYRLLHFEPNALVTCGYFQIPRAVSETRFVAWSDLDRDLLDAAGTCAEGIIQAIRENRCWPPAEDIERKYDDFAALFHRGVAESIDWPEVVS